MKKIIVLLVACLSVGMLRANYWTPVDEGQYAYSMTLYGVIQIDGVEQYSDQLEVGVFCGDECRGSAFANEFFLTHRYLAEVNVYGENGHQLTFKLYDHRTNQELAPTSTEALAFTLDGYGNPIEPYVLNFTPIVPSTTYHFITAGNWSKASNWSGGALPGANDAVSIDANCTLNGNATVVSLAVSTGKTLTLPSGKMLTVTNTLTNTATTGLVIEDAAQLRHASDNVSATVKKNIAGHGTNAGKYYLISNPLTSVVNPEMSSVYHLITGSYDLYSWLPSTPDNLEWRNIKDNSFLMSPEASGYLYANQTGIELYFPGILKPSHNRYAKSVSYDTNDTEHPGWNLIGNPFMCNAKLVNANNEPLPYYRMNAAGNGFEAVAPGTPIAPMEGVFYKASENGTVYFIGADYYDSHAYVDLGLPSGLLWATCNVGADNPEDYGDYFVWGETQTKDTYNWSTYQYCMGSIRTMTKYCNNSSYGYNGFTDNLTTLLPEDDAATANLGSGWRMPTKEEWQELYQNTTHTRTTQNGVNGLLFTASNGNSLFLPAAGYASSPYGYGNGFYWSSSLYTGSPCDAWYFYFDSGSFYMRPSNRFFGQSVRGVRSSRQN